MDPNSSAVSFLCFLHPKYSLSVILYLDPGSFAQTFFKFKQVLCGLTRRAQPQFRSIGLAVVNNSIFFSSNSGPVINVGIDDLSIRPKSLNSSVVFRDPMFDLLCHLSLPLVFYGFMNSPLLLRSAPQTQAS